MEERSLLRQIGEHPFITVRQLCRMLDVSQSWIYGSLGELEAEGMVRKLNPRHPAIRARALYYLTPDGEAQLSLPRRRGRPRFLQRIAMVYEVRNLFISMRRAGLSLSQWQVLAPSMCGVSLHGVTLTSGDQCLIVEWDRGERPIRLYRHRLQRVTAVASEMGAGLLLVAADDARGSAMLSILAGHLNPQGPHLGLTTRSIIATQDLSAAICYVPAIADFVSLGGFVETLPRFWGEALPLSPGVMAFAGQWGRISQLVLELSPLQKELLSILAGLPLVDGKDLALLAGRRSEEWVQRALVDLQHRELIGDYVADHYLLQRHYFVTYTGLAFLAAACGASPKAYARARGWSVRDGEISVSHLVRVFEHTREARAMAMAMVREATRQRQAVTWYDEREAYVYFTVGGRRRVLAPDARVRWGDRVFFVEVDRGTASLGRLRDKLKAYYDFHSRAEYRCFGEKFRLLVVAPHPYRERRWLELVSSVAAERHVGPLDILTTTRSAIQKRGIDAPIWRGVQDRNMRGRFTKGEG